MTVCDTPRCLMNRLYFYRGCKDVPRASIVAFRTMDRVRVALSISAFTNQRDPSQQLLGNVRHRSQMVIQRSILIFYSVAVSIPRNANAILRFSWLITQITNTIRKWEISRRACITAARRVNTGHLALSLENLRAHPGRGPSNDAWEVNTHACLYKSITKGNTPLWSQFLSIVTQLEWTFNKLSPLTAVVHPEAVKWCSYAQRSPLWKWWYITPDKTLNM